MQKAFFSIGLMTLGVALFSTVAIAETETAPRSQMAELSLPTLAQPLPAAPTATTQAQADVIPAGSFTDLSPNHWAFTAVTNLSVDYNCLAGYPDGTFRSDELVTRNEFAVALEACLNTLVQLVDEQPQFDTEQVLNDLDALNQELGRLNEQLDGSTSEDPAN
ncbi:MAG: S-layer homology domain-containing protein [Leptolyngbyaceae cyanobacterium]